MWPAVVFLAIITYAGGIGTGWPLLQHAAYALLGVLIVAYCWAAVSRRGLVVTSSLDRLRVTAGDEIVETVRLRKVGAFPPASVVVERHPDRIAPLVDVTQGEDGCLRRTRIFPHRGQFETGGENVLACDPFGLFSLTVQRLPVETVTVYPRPIEVPHVTSQVLVASRQRRRLDRSDALLGDIRPYVSGDAPSRIHWKSTARTGTLMVRDDERSRRPAVWLAVDLGHGADAADGTAGMAAYLVESLGESGLEVGALIAGRELVTVPPRRGRDHRQRILEALATVVATPESQVAYLVRSAARCDRPDCFVLVSPTPELGTAALRRISSSLTCVSSAPAASSELGSC